MSRLCFVSNFPSSGPSLHVSCKKTHLNWAHLPYRVVWDHLRLFHCFPGSFPPPTPSSLSKTSFQFSPRERFWHILFFFFLLFWLIASDDLNAPCRLMPGTACWLDVPKFGSDIRLLEMNLSFLHLLSVSQPTFPLPPLHITARSVHTWKEQGCTHIRCLTKN